MFFSKDDILDTFLKDKPIAIPYELKIFHNGEKIFSKKDIALLNSIKVNYNIETLNDNILNNKDLFLDYVSSKAASPD
mgnify:CR=1 FL=1